MNHSLSVEEEMKQSITPDLFLSHHFSQFARFCREVKDNEIGPIDVKEAKLDPVILNKELKCVKGTTFRVQMLSRRKTESQTLLR